jgi:MFS transporter, UMF1 family
VTRAPEAAAEHPASRRARFSWVLFDWGGNSFATIILGFVFSAYFTREVAETAEAGTTQWGVAIALAGVAVAIVAPVAGAIADQGGRVKPWLAAATACCIAASASLWLVAPEVSAVVLCLALIGVGQFGFELGFVFYNALLPTLVSRQRMGRLSGRGWAMGYAGGLVSLCIALFVFVLTDSPPFGLDKQNAEHVRIVGPLAAIWFALFCLPLFIWTPDREEIKKPYREMVRDGFAQLRTTFERARAHANLFRFLIARLFYIDGLNTMFAFGGVYAAGGFDMSIEEVTMFGIALNVAAGIGALGGGWLDDRIGGKRTVLFSLLGIVFFGAGILLVDTKLMFWLFALPLGLFMGPVQSSSRSLMARLSDPGMESGMFGLYATSGMATAFVGPIMVAWLTAVTDSQRIGIGSIMFFFLAGILLLLAVEEPRGAKS